MTYKRKKLIMRVCSFISVFVIMVSMLSVPIYNPPAKAFLPIAIPIGMGIAELLAYVGTALGITALASYSFIEVNEALNKSSGFETVTSDGYPLLLQPAGVEISTQLTMEIFNKLTPVLQEKIIQKSVDRAENNTEEIVFTKDDVTEYRNVIATLPVTVGANGVNLLTGTTFYEYWGGTGTPSNSTTYQLRTQLPIIGTLNVWKSNGDRQVVSWDLSRYVPPEYHYIEGVGYRQGNINSKTSNILCIITRNDSGQLSYRYDISDSTSFVHIDFKAHNSYIYPPKNYVYNPASEGVIAGTAEGVRVRIPAIPENALSDPVGALEQNIPAIANSTYTDVVTEVATIPTEDNPPKEDNPPYFPEIPNGFNDILGYEIDIPMDLDFSAFLNALDFVKRIFNDLTGQMGDWLVIICLPLVMGLAITFIGKSQKVSTATKEIARRNAKSSGNKKPMG